MYNKLAEKITYLLIGSIVITLITISGVMFWMSAEHNRKSAEDSIVRIEGGLRSLESSLRLMAIDYTWWQEAYDNVRAENGAWVYANMGSSVTDADAENTTALDLVYIVSETGIPQYGWIKDGRVDSDISILDPGLISELTQAVADAPLKSSSGILRNTRIGGYNFMLVATRILPNDFDNVDETAFPVSIMGYRLDQPRITAMGEAFMTDGLALSDHPVKDFENIAITDAGGQVLTHLIWQAPRPGGHMLRRSALPVIIALALFSLFGFITVRTARNMAQALVDQNEQSRELMIMAQAANNAKTEFLANITHELRTPMIGVIGTADILAASNLSPRDRGMVDIVKHSGTSLLAIIDNILEYSRVESGDITLVEKPFSLKAHVERVVKPHEKAAHRKGLNMTLELAPDLTELVIGDPRRISQIVNNLVSNAVKFTENGWVRIHLSSQAINGIANVAIQVQDTGIGIAPDKIDLAFEKFQQIDRSLSSNHEGAGLGLSISNWLVNLMGGSIQVQSHPGQGSIFTAFLPLPISQRAQLKPVIAHDNPARAANTAGPIEYQPAPPALPQKKSSG